MKRRKSLKKKETKSNVRSIKKHVKSGMKK